ncbi:MAG: neutral/alkaline non-lysosomal ceramidase N-terminal domain-containing protein [Candidatus Omnitrophota bacterium]
MASISFGFAEDGTNAKTLLAGAAKSNITPMLDVSLAGWMTDRTASHIHDDLYARCLVLNNGEAEIAIAICDLLAIGREQADEAKRLIQKHTGILPERILIAATHTHTGPTTAHVFQSEPDKEYIRWCAQRIADGVRRAKNNLRPARIAWGAGNEESLVFNRRYFMKPGTMPENPWGRNDDLVKMNPGYDNPNVEKPAGPVDPQLCVIAIQDLEGYPIAVLGNYALHYVGSENGNEVSADYFGMWDDLVERELAPVKNSEKPPCIAILTNGTSGDINNIDIHKRVKPSYPYDQMNQVARIAAAKALKVMENMEYRDWVPLDIKEKWLETGVRKPSADEIEEAKNILQQAGSEIKTLRQIYARESVLMADWPEKVEIPVQALRIGDAGIATLPGEVFVELGLEVKKKSPFLLTFCIELANAYDGYIPTAAAHQQGGYETWRARSSFLAPDAGAKIVAAALDMLEQIHGDK